METGESAGQSQRRRFFRALDNRCFLPSRPPSSRAGKATIRKSYYEALEAANKSNEVTEWLAWSGGIILEAQRHTLAQVEFLLDKARLLDRLRGTLNVRQEKALLRMFEEGPGGFTGGLSAGRYRSITGATSATTTRDLSVLVEKGALVAMGELKGRRYRLNVPSRPTPRVTINELGEVTEAQ